ncbi:MAG: disulfide bond formation protein DsbA [Arcobacter sp.]|uniref:DsbA family protein n=1 Tax=uncultured Arcobacter sp. TaxID=165434 RepID=UPI000CC1E928|nr:thioredoxin domain-containing protein [uncultured Arcobacter sp.]PLY09000.1 MAG: disulfide bond formation protein DsbA [Arcobacter sp.]
MQNKKVVIVSVAILIGLFLIGGYFYKQNKTDSYKKISNENAELFQRDYSLVIGPKDAKVQLVEFFDPACGACAYYYPYVKGILKKHKDDIKLVVRYAPFHQNSNYAVKMLEGARAQNLFNETLELMFNTQAQWIDGHVVNPRNLWIVLERSNLLDMKRLSASMDDIFIDKIVEQDLSDARVLNVRKTPSFFVNGKLIQELSLDNLNKLIESEL